MRPRRLVTTLILVLTVLIIAYSCATTPKRSPWYLMKLRLMPKQGIMEVDDAFIAKTAEWREYIEGFENVKWERIEKRGVSSQEEQLLYYLTGQPIKMTWDPHLSGKPLSIQYYKDGIVYIVIADLNEDGLPDQRQYYSGKKVQYVEISKNYDGQFTHWWQCRP